MKNYVLVILFGILITILCYIGKYAIATSDLPFWFKFWLLK